MERGSLQAYKTSKKTLEFKLKSVSDFKATANFFNFLSFKKKNNQFIDLFIFTILHKNIIIQ